MKIPKLKSFDEQMLEQGYRNVTGHSTEHHGKLICFGTYIEKGNCDGINWDVTDKCLAEPMKEAGLDGDIGYENI